MQRVIEALQKVIEAIKEVSAQSLIAQDKRFKVLEDGWILDVALKIEWAPSSKVRMNWHDAHKYAAELGGRLPKIKELHSLVDYEKHSPAVDTTFFGDTKTDDWYWTGTEVAGNSSCAWIVGFNYGDVSSNSKGGSNYVRPVRASQSLIV